MFDRVESALDSVAFELGSLSKRVAILLKRFHARSDHDNNFDESDHPRDNDGKFSSGGGGGASAGHQKAVWKDGKLASASGAPVPAHISKLRIPPAWTDVTYSDDPKSALLVTGRDKKGRRQAVYSAEHSANAAMAKFSRINELDAKFDSIREQNEKARRDPKTRGVADCAALIMVMGVRPGSDSDTKADKKAYGATTLEGKHVVVDGDKVSLRFTGKKGVALDLPVENAGIAKMLVQRKRDAGEDGKLFGVSDKALLDHVHSFDGGGFKTKDFRTLLATRTANDEVDRRSAPKDEKSYKKAVMEVAKAVSRKLGNTPVIALQSYINPSVFSGWRMEA